MKKRFIAIALAVCLLLPLTKTYAALTHEQCLAQASGELLSCEQGQNNIFYWCTAGITTVAVGCIIATSGVGILACYAIEATGLGICSAALNAGIDGCQSSYRDRLNVCDPPTAG